MQKQIDTLVQWFIFVFTVIAVFAFLVWLMSCTHAPRCPLPAVRTFPQKNMKAFECPMPGTFPGKISGRTNGYQCRCTVENHGS